MKQNDQIMIKEKIIRNDTPEEEEKSERDFKQKDELDGILQLTDSVAIVGNKEIKLDIYQEVILIFLIILTITDFQIIILGIMTIIKNKINNKTIK